MNIPMIFHKAAKFAAKNSPMVLTGVAIASFIGTVSFAITATRRSILIVDQMQEDYLNDPRQDIEPPTKADIAKKVAPLYIPMVVMGGITVACMIGATKISARRNAVLASLYSTSQLALKEYQDKVVERIGEKEERQVRDEIARDRIVAHPVQDNQVVITGRGHTLCFESLSGRYFESDIEKLRQIENIINKQIINQMWVTLNDFYGEVGLEPIELGHDQGWNVDHMLKFYFSSQLASDGRPCLVVGYEELPRPDYRAGM